MRYIVRRLIVYAIIIFVATNLAFFIPRLAPGNYADIVAPTSAFPAQTRALLDARFGLLQPIWVQYGLYLRNVLLTFPPDFGFSYQYYPLSVSALIIQRIPQTAFLLGASMVLGFLISFGLAAYGSVRRGSKSELGMLYASITMHSLPSYWLAMILLWAFAVSIRIFPTFGIVSATATGTWNYVSSFLWHNVLPVTVMTAGVIGHWYLIIRGATQQVLKSDYVTSAKVRGLSNRVMAFGYILRNSLLPVVSVMAFSVGQLIGLAILVEAVFGYAGLGDVFADAVAHRDYPVLEGALFWTILIVVIAGIIGDLVLLRLDPRLRKESNA